MAVSEDEIILRARIRDEMSRQLRDISEETLRLAGYMRTADGRVRSLNGRFASGRRVLALYNGGLRGAHRDTVRMSGSLDRMARNASQATRQILRLTAAVLGLSLALRATRGLFGAIRGIQGETKLLIALFATLIPAAVPFFAVTTASALSMGSAITSAGVALGVLLLAFSGVGEAVSALASGDMDKINEAFANLSDAGQEFARTLFGLKPALDTLRGTAQTAVLPGVQDALLTLVQILPNLNALVAVFGRALGQVAQQFADAFTSAGFTDFLQFLTDNVSDLNAMTASFITLSGAVGDLFVAFYPLNEAIGGGALARAIQNFADFASGATGTLGQFLTYIEAAIPTVSEFYNLFGSTLLELLEQLGQPGIVVLQALNGILQVLTDLAPTVGALAQAIGVGLLGVTTALIPIIEEVGPLLGQVLVAAATAVADALIALAPHIGLIADFLSQQLLNAVNLIAPFLPKLGEAFLGVLDALSPLIPVVLSLIPLLGDTLLGIFAALTPVLVSLVQALIPVVQSLIEQLAPFLPTLTAGLGQVLTALIPLIPVFTQLLIDVIVPLLPPLLELTQSALPLLTTLIQLLVPVVGFLAQALSVGLQPILAGVGYVIQFVSDGLKGLNILFSAAIDPIKRFLEPLQLVVDLMSKLGVRDTINLGVTGLKGALGDTGAAHGSGSLSSTLGAHAGIMAGLSGGVAISNALIGGGGRGYGSGDHQAGRALDLVGPGVGAYGSAARAAGHYAAMHGTGGNRHLHVAYRQGMGDTGASMAPRGPVSVGTATGGGAVVVNFYGPVYGLEDFDARVGQAVDEKDRVAAARRKS